MVVGMLSPVRCYHAITAEVVIIGLVAEIPSVSQHSASVRLCFIQTLVDPVPNESAQQHRVFFNHVPIFVQITHAVAHGVSILIH